MAERLPCKRSSSATAAFAVGKDLPLGLGLLGFGAGADFGGNRSAIFRPTAARIAAGAQPAWQFTKALPSSPTDALRLALPSSWAGQRADQPLPDFFAPGSLARRISM